MSPGVKLCQRSSVFTSEDDWQRLPTWRKNGGGGGGEGVKFQQIDVRSDPHIILIQEARGSKPCRVPRRFCWEGNGCLMLFAYSLS